MSASGTKPATLRVLIVDDNQHDAALEIRTLKRAGLDVETRVAKRESEYRAALLEFSPDVVLCDFSFPDFDGLSALRIARELAPVAPVIFVSGTVSEERAVIAVRHGAVDYVLKTNLVRLPDAVVRAVEEARERMRRRAAEDNVQRLRRIRDVLSAMNSAILRIEEPPALFEAASRIAAEIGGFRIAMVAMVDPATHRGTVEAIMADFPREIGESVVAEAARDIENAHGVLAESLRRQRPIVINDPALFDQLVTKADTLREGGIASIGSFPFTTGGTATGALVLGASDPGFFNDEEIELVSGLTHNLAFALELAAKRKRVDYLSYYDPMTELPNRSLAFERLRQEIAAAARRGNRLALIAFDLAQFASIGMAVGERAADEILRTVAARLTARYESSLVGRIGGDRFSFMLPGLRTSADVMDEFSRDGLAILNEPVSAGGREFRLTAHVGCAIYPDDGADADDVFRNAQAALQSARSSGAAYRFYAPELNARVGRRLELEARLRRAAADETFVLHYQPKVDVVSHQITGIEALMRWPDPDDPAKLVSPAEFIPILEDTGLIADVGRWALREAARQHRAWMQAGLKAPRIAVNISPVQLRSAQVVDDVIAALDANPGDHGLDLEVTESGIVPNLTEAIAMLRRVRDLGVETALDDFGTGYSSLSYLAQLPITTLKIDRSFIAGMTEHADRTTIVSTIITLGRELRLRVVAEGVETEQQAQLLRLLRCDQMQGYLIARPMPADALAATLPRA
ncbi:MAG TPA: EAL domain-containing protein [Candidatus Elarobacter sp.]|nr:EAL domain-containing protein [Candidatus Elarobacter sp.]